MTAVFRPDPSNPTVNTFVNTTPQSGICPWHIPTYCQANGLFTIRTYDLRAVANAPIRAFHTDPRQGAMWKLPTHWREVVVTHAETGRSEIVQMRLAGFGHRWDAVPRASVFNNPVNANNWWSNWTNAPSPCQGVNYSATNGYYMVFFWLFPENAGVCNRIPSEEIQRFSFAHTEYAYAIKTPNPLSMAAGEYTGSMVYTVGPGADIDFGDVMIPNDNILAFNFTLSVDHQLKVEVPPGGNRIQLEPQEGWQAWLNTGRKPSRLFRDQTVNLWASSQFKMTLECAEPMGNTCSMRNPAGHQVPFHVAVSLPPGLRDGSGLPVNRLPLRLDGSGTERFEPSMFIDRKPSTLHFEVKADAVEQMLEQPGSTYSGTATVVWDSEV
ncbi:MAG TPA: hypothetical protein DIW86_22805 [Pseudomonas sp.]|nr:hypothetical protein [Pseudomonas sp.]